MTVTLESIKKHTHKQIEKDLKLPNLHLDWLFNDGTAYSFGKVRMLVDGIKYPILKFEVDLNFQSLEKNNIYVFNRYNFKEPNWKNFKEASSKLLQAVFHNKNIHCENVHDSSGDPDTVYLKDDFFLNGYLDTHVDNVHTFFVFRVIK